MFDENGKLIVPTLTENMEAYQKEYEKTFGLIDIAPSSALGSDLAITAEMKKVSDEFIQNAFMQNSPFEAIGEALDNICFLRGIKRKIDEHSICLVEFSGADGIIVPKGSLVKNSLTDEYFATNEQGVISSGIFKVYATAVNAGRVVCNADTLNVTDITELTVNNPIDGNVGFLKESDTDLRKRLLNYVNSLSVDEELYVNLLNIRDVKYVNIVSNAELIADSNGIPAKSTSVVILGGDNKSIAQEIFKTISADKRTFGTLSEVISSNISNKDYVVNFSRPEAISVVVEVTITKDTSFNTDDVGVIRESILDFFADKFSISNDVLIDSLYIPIQQDYNNNNPFFKGIKQVSIKINGATSNIAIAYNEYAVLSDSNLTIIVV